MSCLLMLGLCASAQAELKTQVIEYPVGETRMTGYLAYDAAVSRS